MKLAIICPYKYPVPAVNGGAVENIVQQIAFLNEERTFELTIFSTFDEKAKKAANLYKAKFIYIKRRNNAVWDLFDRFYNKFESSNFRSEFVSSMKEFSLDEFDAVIVENHLETLSHISRIYKGKLYYHLHCDSINRDTPKRVKVLSKTNATVICVSDFISSRVRECVPDIINVVTLHNSVDVNVFKPDSRKHEQITIGFCGRMIKEKGIDLLLESFKRVVDKNPQVKLLIIGGSGFATDENNEFFLNLKQSVEILSDKVGFTGYVSHDEVPAYLNSCDIIVIPSQCNDAFPLACLEAMACGKPVIASACGGLPEMISSDCLIPLSDQYANALYNKLIYMTEHVESTRQIGNKNRTIVESQFNSIDYLHRLDEILSK